MGGDTWLVSHVSMWHSSVADTVSVLMAASMTVLYLVHQGLNLTATLDCNMGGDVKERLVPSIR